MIIDLLKLELEQVDNIIINNKINIPKEYYENTDIKSISDVKIKGKIVYHGEDVYELILNVKCDLIVPCSVSLEDVTINIDIDLDENIGPNEEENNKIINNTIDLIPIIWQNIILEVPLKVTSPNIDRNKLKGQGWKLVTSENELKDEIDPRLEKLKEFLSNKERS